MKIVELRHQRAKAVHDARAILNTAETEKRDMSAEERENFDKLMGVVDDLASQIAELKSSEDSEREGDYEDEKKKLDEAEREMAEEAEEGKRRAPRMATEKRGRGDSEKDRDQRQVEAFRSWMRNGREHRDLVLGTDSSGGFLITPTKLSKDIIIALNNMVFVRQMATVETLTEAKSLGTPTITTDVSDADWTAEVPSSLTADSSFATGRRDLTPQLLSKLVLASHRLLMASSQPEQIINQRLAYKFGVAEEKAFLTGDGSSKPLGMFVASSNGIASSRDTTAASTTTFTADELINTLYSIPQQYTQSKTFGWIMHRDAVKIARRLKDGNGQYLWQMGIAADRPDTLLGYPLYQSEYAPNTFTTGLYVALCGDFAFYKIAEVAQMEVQRLVERYADTNQIGFLGRRYLDAAPVLGAAFARLKLA